MLPEISGSREESSLSGDASSKERKSPLRLPEPHVSDLVVRVTPPPGFVPGPLPSSEAKQFGPMSFSRRFEAIGGVVVATFHLDTGAGTLTAAEVNSVRSTLSELGPKGDLSRWVVPVEFEYRGAKQLREGRWKEAIDEYRQLSQQYASRPGPRWHYAKALLKAGFGDAARKLIRQVVAMEPKSAEAYAQLGRILSHDLLGRYLRPGMDRPGALAAFRKAIELDPSESLYHIESAILFEYDDAGRRYSSDADLHAAIMEYREARNRVASLGQYEQNLLIDMFYTGDYAGVEKRCDELASCPWNGLVAANEAVHHGAEAADRKIRQITQNAEERRVALLTASDHLNRSRLYPQSLALLRMAMSKETDETALRTHAQALSRMRRVEEVQFPVDDPRYVVQQALVAALAGGKWEERLLDLFTTTSTATDKAASLESTRTVFREFTRTGRMSNFPPQRIADAVSLFEVAIDGGDDTGRRVLVTNSRIPSLKLTWYVIREPKGNRILAIGRKYANLGLEALRQLEANHPETAVRWLDWAYKDSPKPGVFDSFSATPFTHIWMWAHRSQLRPETVRLAAAALAAEGTDPSLAVPLLVFARNNTEKSDERLQIDLALALAYSQLRWWAELLEIMERLRHEYGEQLRFAVNTIAALEGLNRQDELSQFVRVRLEKLAGKPIEQEFLAGLACDAGALDSAQEILRSRARQGKISPTSLNQLAWSAVYQQPPAADVMRAALDADRRTDRGTLLLPMMRGLLYAEQGRTVEARENMFRYLDDRAMPPGDTEWYVLGRIAEQFGLSDIAAELYRKVSPPKLLGKQMIYYLAQRRLMKQGAPEVHASKQTQTLIRRVPNAPSVPRHNNLPK
jgi:tetratricopeptide (TPR) repeat protein